MKALISPQQQLSAGQRIVQVTEESFEVAEPLFWVDVATDIRPETHYWDAAAGQAVAMVSAPSQAEIIAVFTAAIQKRLDDFARTRNYDGILSACTYATDPNPTFAAEGQYCVNKRSETWAAAYTILAQVQSGQRPMPAGIADIEADLPALVWPA